MLLDLPQPVLQILMVSYCSPADIIQLSKCHRSIRRFVEQFRQHLPCQRSHLQITPVATGIWRFARTLIEKRASECTAWMEHSEITGNGMACGLNTLDLMIYVQHHRTYSTTGSGNLSEFTGQWHIFERFCDVPVNRILEMTQELSSLRIYSLLLGNRWGVFDTKPTQLPVLPAVIVQLLTAHYDRFQSHLPTVVDFRQFQLKAISLQEWRRFLATLIVSKKDPFSRLSFNDMAFPNGHYGLPAVVKADAMRYYRYYSENEIRMDAEPNAMIYADGLKQLLNDKSEASYHCNLMQHPIISIDKFLIQFIEWWLDNGTDVTVTQPHCKLLLQCSPTGEHTGFTVGYLNIVKHFNLYIDHLVAHCIILSKPKSRQYIIVTRYQRFSIAVVNIPKGVHGGRIKCAIGPGCVPAHKEGLLLDQWLLVKVLYHPQQLQMIDGQFRHELRCALFDLDLMSEEECRWSEEEQEKSSAA